MGRTRKLHLRGDSRVITQTNLVRQPNPTSFEWMSLSEAATYLGVSTKMVRKLCTNRRLKHMRVGNQGRLRTGKYRFQRAWLDEYLANAVVPTVSTIKPHRPKKAAPLITTVYIDPNECGNPFEAF